MQAYEARLNPFVEFQQHETESHVNKLNLHDRALLSGSRHTSTSLCCPACVSSLSQPERFYFFALRCMYVILVTTQNHRTQDTICCYVDMHLCAVHFCCAQWAFQAEDSLCCAAACWRAHESCCTALCCYTQTLHLQNNAAPACTCSPAMIQMLQLSCALQVCNYIQLQ